MRQAITAGLVLAAAALAGCKPGIKKFAVTGCVCRGGHIRVQWDARGTPVLQASPPPAGWRDGPVASSGDRQDIVIERPTKFRMRVPGANPANGDASREQDVAVVERTMDATVLAGDCHPSRRVGAGVMQPVASCGVPATRMSNPIVELADGTKVARRICLVDPGGRRVCVDAGGSAPLHAVIDSGWQIELPFVTNEQCDSQRPVVGALSFDIDCGASL